MDIVRELGYPVHSIMRYSDTCSSQFRSKHVMGDLRDLPRLYNLPPGGQVTLSYFESNEGKNVSDVIGAMGKNSFRRGIHKNRSGITGVEDAISRIKANLQVETKEFKHIVYESFPTIERLSKEQLKKKEEPLKGIMKCHQIYVDIRGKLQGRELSCLTCTIRYRCTKCA